MLSLSLLSPHLVSCPSLEQSIPCECPPLCPSSCHSWTDDPVNRYPHHPLPKPQLQMPQKRKVS